MVTSAEDFNRFVKRWTITVVYIAVILTIILGIKLFEVFWR